MKSQFNSIAKVKSIFRENHSILIDELIDPVEVRRYLYRLVKRNILYVAAESNNYVHYCKVKHDNIIG